MSEFRFHIASLAAVFLALGIGIFVGTAFVGAPVVDRQTRLIRRLEENVSTRLKEASEREKSEEALRGLLPALVHNKLTGRRVLVVQTGAFPAASEAVADALRLAGAETVGRVSLPVAAWQLASGGGGSKTSGQAEGTESETSAAVERLVPVLLNPTESTVRPLRDAGLISGESELSGAFRLIVFVGGANGAETVSKTGNDASPLVLAQTRDLPLIRALQNANAAVVGCEPLDADVSFISAYQTADISTIDAVDRAAGQIALPLALNGEKGNYGYKGTAERVLPVSLTTIPSSTPAPTPSSAVASPTPAPSAAL